MLQKLPLKEDIDLPSFNLDKQIRISGTRHSTQTATLTESLKNMSLILSLNLSEARSATFSELEVNYPVSCIISNIVDKSSKLVYCGSYGGGMISGDRYVYNILVGKGSRLFIRNTSSTKVYKRIEDRTTCQIYNLSLEKDSYLSMIPEPLTCFKDSK